MYLSLKTATAEKIGKTQGSITYRILCDEAQEHLFIAITGNDDEGHYSDEIVPFSHIEKCVEGLASGTHIASKQFFGAFESRSNNNCGFLAAILRSEELLAPIIDGIRKHVLQPSWDKWKETMLTELGEPYEPPVKAMPIPPKKKAVSNAKSK